MHSLKKTFKDNLLALIAADTGPLRPNETGVTRLIKKGFANGTAQRLLNDTDIGIELIAEVAQKFRVSPWQLLVEGMSASSLPTLADGSNGWPFEMVDREPYQNLSSKDRVFVQGKIDQAIKDYAAALSRKQIPA